jgi:hypothetical protein
MAGSSPIWSKPPSPSPSIPPRAQMRAEVAAQFAAFAATGCGWTM